MIYMIYDICIQDYPSAHIATMVKDQAVLGQTSCTVIHTAVDALVRVGERRSEYRGGCIFLCRLVNAGQTIHTCSGCTCAGW